MSDQDDILAMQQLAGKVGICIRRWNGMWRSFEVSGFSDLAEGGFWNPLTDDGDALRLAVKLGITVDPTVGLPAQNRFSGARRSIVRAAVEILERK